MLCPPLRLLPLLLAVSAARCRWTAPPHWCHGLAPPSGFDATQLDGRWQLVMARSSSPVSVAFCRGVTILERGHGHMALLWDDAPAAPPLDSRNLCSTSPGTWTQMLGTVKVVGIEHERDSHLIVAVCTEGRTDVLVLSKSAEPSWAQKHRLRARTDELLEPLEDVLPAGYICW